jgi:SAM-dependent methyltransferase
LRPYTRSLDPEDYHYLHRKYSAPLRAFLNVMMSYGIPHREWHPHRFWEYASILQQLDELQVPPGVQMIDIGSGGSFFPPYLVSVAGYVNLELVDSMKYGDVTDMIAAQRAHYKIALPLHDLSVEAMPSLPSDFYDVVMCISTLEHVETDQHDNALREIGRITKPGGLIFITSDYFRDRTQYEGSTSRSLQLTPYTKEFVLDIPQIINANFVGEADLDYRGDFVQNYSFVNICLRKAA